MRQQKPWYRASRNAWYVQVDGRKVRLADNEEDAWTAFYRLMHERGRLVVDADTLSFGELAEQFLEDCQANRKPTTYDWYVRFLDDFDACYQGTVANLTPSHVNAWLAKHPDWSPATRRGGIVAVKRAIHWGIKDRRIVKSDPLSALKRPDGGRREVCAGASDLAAIVAETDNAFAAFVLAVRETGARPGEVRTIEARQFDAKAGTWTFQPAECIKRSKRPRVFYLTPAMVVLSSALSEANPTGPMFRNSRSKPWTANAVRCRMRRLRAKGVIAEGTVVYSFRHGYATDALANGVTTAELAQLMGHRDTRMIDEFYGHLDQRGERLKAAARKAVS